MYCYIYMCNTLFGQVDHVRHNTYKYLHFMTPLLTTASKIYNL